MNNGILEYVIGAILDNDIRYWVGKNDDAWNKPELSSDLADAKRYDDLEKAGVIAKWRTAKGGKNITNYDKDTLSLDVWAKDPTKVYITPSQNKALRASKKIYQKEWLTALKQLHNPHKYYETPEALAKDLGITKEQLDIYLGGEEIPDDVGEQAVALKQEWDGR